uniref:Transmembrane protein n=1 Tax=Kalanchoe fedtschenkoi TaxID=63787 RepID=A0A7N0T702_KALFE
MSWRWSSSAFRWPVFEISLSSFPVFQWPELDFSHFIPGRRFYSFSWLDFSFVDSLLWTVVMVVESLALLLMLCFFLAFCGCTI